MMQVVLKSGMNLLQFRDLTVSSSSISDCVLELTHPGKHLDDPRPTPRNRHQCLANLLSRDRAPPTVQEL